MTPNPRPWHREFPDFPADVIPRLGPGWEDQSWDQDACPKFVHEAAGLNLWVDYPDPAQREIPSGGCYILTRLDPDGNSGDSLLETDDWRTMAARIDMEVTSALSDPFKILAADLAAIRRHVASFEGSTVTGGQFIGSFVADQSVALAKIDGMAQKLATLRQDLVQACADATAGRIQEGFGIKLERWDPDSIYGKARQDAAQDVLEVATEPLPR